MRDDTAEIKALTGLRAYAAAWVMLLHLPFSVGVVPHVHHGAVSLHGAWGVDIFFVLSGFILSLLYAPRFQAGSFADTYRGYLAARFARIYPLHAFALLVLGAWFVPRAVLLDQHVAGFGLRQLALNLGLLHGWGYADRLSWNYPSWSISSEWFAYVLLAPALALGLRRASARSCVLIAAALWAALYGALHSEGQLIRDQAIEWSVPRIVAEFTLGYALYRAYERVPLPARQADGLLSAGMLAIVALCYLPDAAEWALAPAIAALIFGLSRAGPIGEALFANRIAVFWGERSYAIYMLHAVVQILSNLLLEHLGLVALPAAGAWVLLVALVLVVLALAHVAYGWIEMPARRWLRARLAARSDTTEAIVAVAPLP